MVCLGVGQHLEGGGEAFGDDLPVPFQRQLSFQLPLEFLGEVYDEAGENTTPVTVRRPEAIVERVARAASAPKRGNQG